MLDDPRLNFAISTRGSKPGIDHLGFQTDDPAELAAMKARAEAADMALLDEGQTTCCYARSEKHWVTDPQGIAWEHFHTLGNIPVFSEAAPAEVTAARLRRTPAHRQGPQVVAASPVHAEAACCKPIGIRSSQAVLLLTAAPYPRRRLAVSPNCHHLFLY
jgi:hypothetical protein